MAINNPEPARITARRSRNRRLWIALLVLLAIVAATVAYNWNAMNAYSRTGASYAARVVCSCRYIGGRSLQDCEKDLEPGMEIVSLAEDENARQIRASVPLLAEEMAELRGASGCILLNEAEKAKLAD